MAKANPGTSVAKAKLNLPVDINALYAQEAEDIARRIGAPGGDKIQVTQSKTFKLPNGQEHPGPLTAIIVDFVSANYYYDKPYQRGGDVEPPKCYALGLEPSGLTPSEKAIERQADSCSACWANQFKSDLQGGNGKACQNTRLLALMAPDAKADDPLMIVKVSSTALKSFDGYVSSIANQFKAPVRAVITDISFDPNSEYASLRFGNPQPATQDQMLLANSRKEEAMKRLLSEPEVTAPAEKPAGRRPQPPAGRGKVPSPAARKTAKAGAAAARR